ncbi:MAG TPA: hypothetical protein VFX01_06240 [Methylophilaceae bacterium]|nr:hypothetical protein [Methylophilaceae bacterium]
MIDDDLRDAKHKEHLQALEEHKALLEKANQTDPGLHMDEIKFSLEKIALTLEEYFKVIGIP